MSAVAPLAEQEQEQCYRDEGTLLGSTQASSFRPFLPWVSVTYVVNLWRLESPHREEYSGMVWHGIAELPPLLPLVAPPLTGKGACSHHVTRFFKTCFPHDKRLFLFDRWN